MTKDFYQGLAIKLDKTASLSDYKLLLRQSVKDRAKLLKNPKLKHHQYSLVYMALRIKKIQTKIKNYDQTPKRNK